MKSAVKSMKLKWKRFVFIERACGVVGGDNGNTCAKIGGSYRDFLRIGTDAAGRRCKFACQHENVHGGASSMGERVDYQAACVLDFLVIAEDTRELGAWREHLDTDRDP